jgi:hypothetical protein
MAQTCFLANAGVGPAVPETLEIRPSGYAEFRGPDFCFFGTQERDAGQDGVLLLLNRSSLAPAPAFGEEQGRKRGLPVRPASS